MNLTEFNARLRPEVEILKENYRNDSSAFLIWFLKNIFCLNEIDCVDSVCDGSRDKGIDGIWVDEEEETIYVFQSEFSPNDLRDSGDTKIREFSGVSAWFSSEEQVQNLENALINLELQSRLNTLKIKDKISRGYNVEYVYVTNKIFDRNATEYLTNTNIDAYDINDLFEKYTYLVEEDIINTPKKLSISNQTFIEYSADAENKTVVCAIPVQELLKLDGIQDHTLFSRNVRLWTGKTRVNKELAQTIENTQEHSKFFLYHNGISIICKNFDFNDTKDEITLTNYQVINGCQSIVSFYQNRSKLSDKMMVLAKIIKVDNNNPLINRITKNANNQNAISAKDLKSNDRVQIFLQRNFQEKFDGKILYSIKRGESTLGYDKVIDIDFAAQLITAFYNEAPYKTHLKTNFYGEEYEKLFSRNITCEKIYLAHLIYSIINENLEQIESAPVRNYGLAKFSFLRIIKSILQSDDIGIDLINNPQNYIFDHHTKLKTAIEKLYRLVALDINAFIEEYSSGVPLFDYKNLFKNKEFCDKMNTYVSTNHKKSIVRHPEDKFEEIYNSI